MERYWDMIKLSITVVLVALQSSILNGQSFEGKITMHVKTDHVESATWVKVRDNKSVRTYGDSSLQIFVHTDEARGTKVVLKVQDDMKYGMRSPEHGDDHSHAYDDEDSNAFDITITDESKVIGEMNCQRVTITSDDIAAEGWITQEIPFQLSKYFPEVIKSSATAAIQEVREAFDSRGFIMEYWEIDRKADEEVELKVEVTMGPLPNETFTISSEFVVLDQASMKTLYQESRTNKERKKQWEEFMLLFGSN